MRALVAIILAGLFFMTFNASASEYYVESVKAERDFKASTVVEFNKILKAEAAKVFPGEVSASKKLAGTLIKPALVQTSLGTKLVLERYDMGELFSTVEVPELDGIEQAEVKKPLLDPLNLVQTKFRDVSFNLKIIVDT